MRVEGREFCNILDDDLDDVVRQVLRMTPAVGLRMVQGSLRQQGFGGSKNARSPLITEGRSCNSNIEKCTENN